MADFVTEDSGERIEFPTGSRRDKQDDKLRFDLIGIEGLERLAGLYARGARKYGDHNWRKGQPVSRYFASMMRHAYMWAMGYRKEDHLAAVVWNAFGIMHVEAYPKKFAELLDHERYDLYPEEKPVGITRELVVIVAADYQVKVSVYGGTIEQLYGHFMLNSDTPYSREDFQNALMQALRDELIQVVEDGYHDALWQVSDMGVPTWWARDDRVVPQPIPEEKKDVAMTLLSGRVIEAPILGTDDLCTCGALIEDCGGECERPLDDLIDEYEDDEPCDCGKGKHCPLLHDTPR